MPEQSLREALEAAYDNEVTAAPEPEETRGSEEDTPEQIRDTAPTEGQADAASEPDDTPVAGRGRDGKFVKKEGVQDSKPDTPSAESTTKPDTDTEPPPSLKAPTSWKPSAREHWAKLPKEVQEDVLRRETETSQALQQTAGARKFAEAFGQMIRPYEQMLRVENAHPLQAAEELFRTAAILRVGNPAQKATMVANMVKQFNISIEDLDRALVGESIPDETGKLQQIIQQQLAPVNQFMQQIQQMRGQRLNQTESEIEAEIGEFSQKEFFEDLRETMGDLMEMAAKRKQEMTLQQAYERAIAITPEIQSILQQRKAAEMDKKKRAASSLPSRSPTGGTRSSSDTIRGSIEEAFEQVATR
jgi:acetolactate synthase small subunit